jgi:hypothetical protein
MLLKQLPITCCVMLMAACASRGGLSHGHYLIVGNRAIDAPHDIVACASPMTSGHQDFQRDASREHMERRRPSGVSWYHDYQKNIENGLNHRITACIEKSGFVNLLRAGGTDGLSIPTGGSLELRLFTVSTPYYQFCTISEAVISVSQARIEHRALPRRDCGDERLPIPQ